MSPRPSDTRSTRSGSSSRAGRPRRAAVVLLSGGMDSATTLAMAREKADRLLALSVSYGQRHARELQSARALARHYRVEEFIALELPLASIAPSALTRRSWPLPKDRGERTMARKIPPTYVPARNTVFLSLALALAESRGVDDIYLGVNAVDYSGYPDCRPEFLRAFERLGRLATARGVEGRGRLRLHAPLLRSTKADIVRRGERLKVPWELTWSCYAGGRRPCGRCDSCRLRAKGFREAGVPDPLVRAPARGQ